MVLEYLPTLGLFRKLPLGVNVGKYSSTMDPMGTRLYGICFLNNFQGMISSRGRYTMMHVGTLKIMIPPVKIPRNN